MAYAYQEALPLVPANYAGAPNQAGFSGWVGPGRAGHVLCWFLHWAWETRAAWGGEMRIVFPVSASSGEDRPAAYGWRRTRRAVTKRHCPLRQSSRGTGNIPLEWALYGLRCLSCGSAGVHIRTARLCTASCPRFPHDPGDDA